MSRGHRIPGKILVSLHGERTASWSFARGVVTGTEFSYAVVDSNVFQRNQWQFVVRSPKAPDGRIDVRPTTVPNLQAWADLERRSLTFARATIGGYRRYRYCQMALADPTGDRTKDVIRKHEKKRLPGWLRPYRHRIRAKGTVRRTRGHDADELVILVRPDDHTTMLRLYFALKVWVLKDRVSLE